MGNYDTEQNNKSKFSIKLDVFEGKGCTIDEDIYLNKFQNDNYFNIMHKGTDQSIKSTDIATFDGNTNTSNHGIGLFDSIITKNKDSKIRNFTLTGSVNTEIYRNEYAVKNQEINLLVTNKDRSIWLSVGGVVGWSTNNIWLGFERIMFDNFTVSGADFVGGLLGYSGIKSNSILVNISQCSANNISVEMTSANNISNDLRQSRNGIGAFVGKVQEGAVFIYGTEDKEDNKSSEKRSEVTIKSFSFADSTGQYYSSAGGLVGFAGNGTRIYDMKVSSSSNTVTIGGEKTRFAGGLVGGMQSYAENEPTCLAYFKNCIVENINIKGEYAGGFYGGKWDSGWTPYTITLDSCQVKGKSETEKNEIAAFKLYDNACAGGFIGRGLVQKSAATGDSNILIKDCTVSNYNIIANECGNSLGYAGGFVGYCSSNAGNSTITCYIHDSSVEDSVIGASGSNSYGGGAIGWINPKNVSYSNKILGYNIKLDNVTSNNTSNMGAWIGYLNSNDTTTSIQFSGMAIYGQGFTQNIGNGRMLNTASFVYADYDGASANMTNENQNKATFNTSNDVDMPKYPYVNVNPQSDMGIREDNTAAVISGDGAVLLNKPHSSYSTYTSGKTMAAKLYHDLSVTTNSRRYTTFDTKKNEEIADGHTLDYYLKRTTSDDGDRISTYETEKGYLPKGVEDFACIMISTADNAETTNLINQYIRLVTNTTDDYTATSSYYAVDVKTCKLITDKATGNGEFKLITDATDDDYAPSIVLSEGQFKMIKDNADSRRENTFTLIDVQFKDPFNTDKVAYHLYVPVFTTVQMEVGFYAAMKTGAKSVTYQSDGVDVYNSEYEKQLDGSTYPEYIHVDNLNSWYTMYFRYSYSKSDLSEMLKTGNLNWNHDKYVILTKDERDMCNMLSESTFMTLVDPNGGADKVYYVSGFNSTDFPRTNNAVKLDFSKFTDAGGNHFEASTLNAMVAQNLEVDENTVSGSGQYDLYNGEGEPSDINSASYVYTMDSSGKKTYYKFNPNKTGDSNLKFKDGYSGLNEDYYVSVYVPETNMDTIYGYEISIDDKFPVPNVNGTVASPKSAKVNTEFDSRQVYLGDLYNQEVTFEVATQDPVITSSNKTIDAYATTKIKAKSRPILGVLASAKNYSELYHSYVLTLDRHGEQGEVSTLISGLKEDGTQRVDAWYSFEQRISDDSNPTEASVREIDVQNNYINVGTVKDSDKLLSMIAPNVDDLTTVTIYSRVRMDFDETKIDVEFPQKTRQDAGVSVRVASNLAYDTSGLAFSSSSMSANDRLERLFYRTSMDTASLYYNPVTPDFDKYDYDGDYSENYTRVGVNGLNSMSEYMPIDTEARYDLQKVAQMWKDAENVQLTISLQKKEDIVTDGKITEVHYTDRNDITQYWGGLTLDTNGKPVDIQKEDGSYQLTLKDSTSIWVESGEYKQEISVPTGTKTITVTISKDDVEYDSS